MPQSAVRRNGWPRPWLASAPPQTVLGCHLSGETGFSQRCPEGAKGIVHTAESPQRRVVLQLVGRRVDISIGDEWGQRSPRTQIVAIGASGAIDGKLLEQTFASRISAAAGPCVPSRLQKGANNWRICSASSFEPGKGPEGHPSTQGPR